MPRSLKKGPFVDDHLLAKVDAQNEKAPSRSSRPGRAARPSSPTSSVTPSPSRRSQARAGVRLGQHGRSKLGEFAPTRTFKGHIKDDRKAKRR